MKEKFSELNNNQTQPNENINLNEKFKLQKYLYNSLIK